MFAAFMSLSIADEKDWPEDIKADLGIHMDTAVATDILCQFAIMFSKLATEWAAHATVLPAHFVRILILDTIKILQKCFDLLVATTHCA